MRTKERYSNSSFVVLSALFVMLYPLSAHACSNNSGGPVFFFVYFIYLSIPIVLTKIYALWRILPKGESLLRLGLTSFGMSFSSAIVCSIIALLIGIGFVAIGLYEIHEILSLLLLIPLYYISVSNDLKYSENSFQCTDKHLVQLAVRSANFHVFFMLGIFFIARIGKMAVVNAPLMI